jgi:integrase
MIDSSVIPSNDVVALNVLVEGTRMGKSYQRGTLRRVKRVSGTDAWEWRYTLRGKQKQETFSTAEFPTEKDIWQHLETSISLLNRGSREPLPLSVTMGVVIDKYVKEYLPDLAKSTRDTDGSMLKLHVKPRWGKVPVTEVEPMDVDAWLKTLKMSQSSKGRARRMLKQLIDRAMYWKLIPRSMNPITLVKVKGSTLREKRIEPWTQEQVTKLFDGLAEPYNVMVAVMASLGLRAEEMVALKWDDFDFEKKRELHIQRAYTHGELGATKSTASAAKLPVPEDLITLLKAYQKKSKSEWLFPSPVTGGPRSADMLLADHLKPAAEKLKLPKPGWHLLRHSYRSWIAVGDATLSQQKDMMRHSAVSTTDIYGGSQIEEMRPLVEAVSAKLKLQLKPLTSA